MCLCTLWFPWTISSDTDSVSIKNQFCIHFDSSRKMETSLSLSPLVSIRRSRLISIFVFHFFRYELSGSLNRMVYARSTHVVTSIYNVAWCSVEIEPYDGSTLYINFISLLLSSASYSFANIVTICR